jgi:hypothetical protein
MGSPVSLLAFDGTVCGRATAGQFRPGLPQMVQGWSAFILEVLPLKIAGRGRQEVE